jgi:hypothetical protein
MFSKHVHEVTHYETHCPRCGEPMKILAFILEREVIVRILRHIGEDADPPPVPPARPPPQFALEFAQTTGPVTWPEIDQTTGYPDEI